MRTYNAALSLTATATATFEAGALIGFDNAPINAADQPVKGVAQNPATEVGLDVAVTVLGMETVVASGPITVGAKLVSAAGGRAAVAGATPANVFATALTAAADGELVQILIR